MPSDDNYAFLHPRAKKMLVSSDQERIHYIYEDVWINYDAAANARATIQAILEMPNRNQAQCLLIEAPEGMGKSSLFKIIQSDSLKRANRLGIPDPLVSFEMPPSPSMNGIGDKFAEMLGVPTRGIKNGDLATPIIELVKLRGWNAMMIDEFHNLLLSNRGELQKVLALIRKLNGPPLHLKLIGVGIDKAEHAIRSDKQLARRFQIYKLPKWRETEVFRSFLATYETLLPLKRSSNLAEQEKVKRLVEVSQGHLGKIVERIQRAAVFAIMHRKEFIDLECIDLAETIPIKKV